MYIIQNQKILLFLMFINDIFNASPSLFSTLYADDINSFSADININSLQMKCNDELNHLAMWYRAINSLLILKNLST